MTEGGGRYQACRALHENLLLVTFLTKIQEVRFKRPVPSVHSKEQNVPPTTKNACIHSCGRKVIQVGLGKEDTLKKHRSWGTSFGLL